jgi:hypothetical protein
MDPAFWGKSTWLFLHTLTFNYPTNPTHQDKIKYYKFFKNLGDLLPCPSCAESYKIYVKYIPIVDYLDDIHGVTFWLYIIHYLVNKKLSKSNLSFNEVVKTYYANKSSCKKIDPEKMLSNEKCTAKPPSNIISEDDTYNEFKNIAETKYLIKIAKQITKLKQDYPNL